MRARAERLRGVQGEHRLPPVRGLRGLHAAPRVRRETGASGLRRMSAQRARCICLLTVLTLLVGCSALNPPQDDSAAVVSDPAAAAQAEVQAQCAAPGGMLQPEAGLWARMRRELRWHTIEHERISRAREHFLAQPDYLHTVGSRAQWYLHYILEQVELRGLPVELALLPFVESAMDPLARSPSSAAGLWQIMPATADHLGLRRSWWFDERLDLRASTHTALDYLEALHAEFDGDWFLALAAYNAGKGRVARAQSRNRRAGLPTDYWSLPLPRETRRYVPRLLALAGVVHDASTLAVTLPEVGNHTPFVAVETGGQLELQRAAQLAGVDLAVLRRLNAGHLRWATAPGHDSLLLPREHAERFRREVAALSPQQRVSWAHYRIRPGDSLITIARRFDTEVMLLQQVNRIDGHLIRAGDTLLIPRGEAWGESMALARADIHTLRKRAYRVRPGDSLYRIATRFRVTVQDLLEWNDLDPQHYLQPGQRLTLYTRDG